MKLFILAFLFLCSTAFAASWATVTAKKAIVYADALMTSEVGFIAKGKKVRIGDNAKNKGQVYPLVYQKRILYIKKVDIQTSTELLALKSAMERVTKKSLAMENFQRVALGVNFGLYNLTSDESYDSEKEKSLFFSGISFAGYLVRPSKKDALKLQFSYQSATQGLEEYSIFNLEVYYHKQLFSMSRLSLDAFAGVIISPYFGYTYGSDFTKNGYGAGAGLGLEAIYMLSKRYSIHLNAQGVYQKLTVELPDEVTPSEYGPSIVGLNTTLSFSYSYE